MCGSSGGSSQVPSATTQTIQQQPPGYVQSAQQQAINQSQQLQATPFPAYQGQMVAPLSPMQNSYFQGVANNQGAWQPTTQQAEGVMNNVASGKYTPNVSPTSANLQAVNPNSIRSGMSQYYDPAVATEIGGMSQAVQRQADIGKAAQDRAYGMQGAYGGSGQAVADAQIQAGADASMGQYASQLLPQAFQQAGQLSGQDISNQINATNLTNQANLSSNAQNLGFQQLGEQANIAAGQLGLQGAQALQNTGLQAQSAGYTDASQLGMAGQAQQNQAQAMLNAPFQQYQSSLQWPFQTLAAEDSALGTVAPYAGTTQTTSQPYSPLSGAIGTGLAGASMINSMGLGSGIRSGGRIGHANGGVIHRDDGGGTPDGYTPSDWASQAISGLNSPGWNLAPQYNPQPQGNTRDLLGGWNQAFNALKAQGQGQPPTATTQLAPQDTTRLMNIISQNLAQSRAALQPDQNSRNLAIAAGLMSAGGPGTRQAGLGLLQGLQAANAGEAQQGSGAQGQGAGQYAATKSATEVAELQAQIEALRRSQQHQIEFSGGAGGTGSAGNSQQSGGGAAQTNG